MRGSRGAGALARFFTKQVLWFIFLVFALLIIDVFLYILIAVHEMDRNYLSLIELGRSSPSVRMLMRLCTALDVRAADVLKDVERRMQAQTPSQG